MYTRIVEYNDFEQRRSLTSAGVCEVSDAFFFD